MGILARMLGFVWRRWADYQSVVAIFDVLDAKTAFGGAFGFLAMIFIGATNLNWSAPGVILAALAAGALVSIMMVAVRLFLHMPVRVAKETSTAELTTSNGFAGDIPNAKIADDPIAWSLFETKERDKLIPLLEAGRLQAWGRLGSGEPALTKIPPDKWTTFYLDRKPADSPGRINQTYLRPKSRPYESTYFDVYLNKSQLERAWPSLWDKASLDRIPCTELLSIATAAGWDFTSQHSIHLIDLQDAMRQGGADNTLVIWGRENKWTSEELMRSELLDKISPDHWKEHFVHLFAARQGDNFNTYSWAPDSKNFGRRGYVDLHVSRSQAMSWLHVDAWSFKGKNKPR